MRANFLHIQSLIDRALSDFPRPVAGDLAEFGVWYGTTFLPMAEVARQHGRRIHAVDSFRGMAPNGPRDDGEYPEGDLSVHGSGIFRELVAPYGPTVVVHEGFIPAVLDELEDVRFAFAHIDLDQYEPTLAALRFVWHRMEDDGIVAVHDWYPESDRLATAAIKDWMAEAGERVVGTTLGRHAWFRKVPRP